MSGSRVSRANENSEPGPSNQTDEKKEESDMKKKFNFLASLILIAACLGNVARSQDEAAPEAVENGILLTVDGTPILASDVADMMVSRFGSQLQQMPPEQRMMIQQQLQQQIVSNLISKTLLLNAANKQGIEVSDAEVDEGLDMIRKNMPEGVDLKTFVEASGSNMDLIRSRVSEDTKIRKVLDQVTAEVVQPGDEAVKKYYDEHPDEFEEGAMVKASHILVSTRGITDEAELAKKEELVADLRKQLGESEGKNFGELAMVHSDCPSKAQGGDLGEFGRGQMVPEFEQAAFTQEVGVVGETVKTDFGYHIIQVTERQDARKLPFEEVEESLCEKLHDQEKGKVVEAYIEELEGKADIVVPGAPKPKAEGESAE